MVADNELEEYSKSEGLKRIIFCYRLTHHDLLFVINIATF